MNELIPIDTLKAAEVFKPGVVERLIADVERKVRDITIDASDDAGRAEAKSLAYKITRSKTALDDMGKNFVAELKKAAGVVDADRRIIRDRLDALRDEVRKPVDQYEMAEEFRKEQHLKALEELKALDVFQPGEAITPNKVGIRLTKLPDFKERNWEEFTDGAVLALAKIGMSLKAMYSDAVKRESEQAELDRLRKAEAERQEIERKAQAEREQKERDERIAAQAKQEAEARERAAIARAEQAEANAKASAERAEQIRQAAVNDALEAARRLEEKKKADEAAALARREANKRHCIKVNREASAAIVAESNCSISTDMATAIVEAIAAGKIPHISIAY